MAKSFERVSMRAQVLPTEIRGLLTVVESGAQLPFLVWDVSSSGMGLWSSESLESGSKVIVTVGHPYLLVVECRVVWCTEESEIGFRMGLEVTKRQGAFEGLVQSVLHHQTKLSIAQRIST